MGHLDPEAQSLVVAQTLSSDQHVWWQLPDASWVRSDVVRASGSCADLPEAD
jgi:hypothetical protein